MGSVDTSLSDLVTIIVKAPNQQIADQTIKCHLNWSIKKLKDYLSQVYPSKPKLEEQKLIYSGKLLTDTAILKDILRTYEGQENHTVHLVCATKANSLKSEKNPLPRSSSTESDSNYDDTHDNEQDNVNGAQSASQRNLPNTPFTFPADGVSFFGQMNANQMPSMGGFDSRFSWPGVSGINGVNDVNVNHHFVMMQQAYAQYLTQYMQMMGQSSPGFMTSPFTNPVSRTPSQSVGTTNHLNFNNFNNLPRVRPPQVVEEENANPPAVAAVGNDVGDEENRNNRDWLDYFYGMSRIAVLCIVVYFYSTPLRLLGVLVILSMFYFQQNLRLQNDQLNANLNNNNINIANNNNQNNANNGENNDRAATPEGAANAAESNGEPNEQADDTSTRRGEAPPVPERLSLIGVTVLAIRTFFLSLVPDTPAI